MTSHQVVKKIRPSQLRLGFFAHEMRNTYPELQKNYLLSKLIYTKTQKIYTKKHRTKT